LTRLAAQEKKLLQAHYDDNITIELFAEEQQRIRRERIAAEKRQEELQVDHGEMLKTLDTALSLTDRVQAAYILAKPTTRRVFNQAIYDCIWIDRETISKTQLASPFAEIQALDQELSREAETGAHRVSYAATGQLEAWTLQAPGRRVNRGAKQRTSTALLSRGGSNVEAMVRMRGLEPPPGFPDTDLNRARLPIPPHPRAGGDAKISHRRQTGRRSARLRRTKAGRLLAQGLAVGTLLASDRLSAGRYRPGD
jgi:hypothetical protein